VVEPSTTAHPAAADRTWTSVYDAADRPVKELQPGGVSVQRTFDALGRLAEATGAGAEASTTADTFGYDAAGRLTTASAPGGTDTFTSYVGVFVKRHEQVLAVRSFARARDREHEVGGGRGCVSQRRTVSLISAGWLPHDRFCVGSVPLVYETRTWPAGCRAGCA
jgi:YD repeat-containing protein